MTGSSNDAGKVSDSGYTNTCVSQSQRSSGSSLSRNSNRSKSSGYCGRPSTFNSSDYALPKPISKCKDKGRKKEKSETSTTTTQTTPTTSLDNIETGLGSQIDGGKPNELANFDSNGSSSDITSNDKKSDEVARVELVDDTGLGEHNGDSNSTEPEGGVGTITNPLDDTTSNINAGFSAVISMTKGLVIDVTPSLQTALGYSRESWIDTSFIDYVHPKDKKTFAEHLAKNIALQYEDRDKDLSGCQTSLFCMLKKSDEGLSSTGNGSDQSNFQMDNGNLYLPFHLTTNIKFFRKRTSHEKSQLMLLSVNADPVIPVYKAPEEMIISTIFSTRHDRSCILTHVDNNVVQYFGYMPHDIIGRSLFDFYHPEDLPFIKDVYETVVKMEGSPFRSKPYRFAAQNGGYVLLETEWSSFYNPWQKKLEFVVGHHRVLRGPTNPNVFQSSSDCQRNLLASISEEIFKESMIIQGEIRALLNEKIQRSEDNEKYENPSRSNDLGIFVENLLRGVKSPDPVSKKHHTTDRRSFLGSQNPLLQECDSVILSAISPHHDYCDSKSSTETPPSYNRLNHNEKITRFFDSMFLVTPNYGSDEDNHNSSAPSNEDARKSNSNLTGTKATTLSSENQSRGSNNRTSCDSRDESDNARSGNKMANESPKVPMLTESVLNKHNREMEKLLVQQDKGRRCSIKNNYKNNKQSRLRDNKEKTNKNATGETKKRGEKRRGGDDCKGDNSKITKIDENTPTGTMATQPAGTNVQMNVDENSSATQTQSRQNINVWPPLGVTVQPPPTPQLSVSAQNNGITQELPKYGGFPSFVPIYYVSMPRIQEDFTHNNVPTIANQSLNSNQPQPNTYVSYAAAPLAGVIYPPMVCSAPPPVTAMYRPFVIPEPVPIHRGTPQSYSGISQQDNQLERNRTASQATSIKAEPGSTMAMSESSKKELFSLGEQFSSCVSIDGGCSSLVPNTKPETNTNSQCESNLEDSSDSSFYGSFLTTSNRSSCNSKLNTAHPAKSQQNLWKPAIAKPTNNERKQLDMLMKGPPWQKDVKMTKELIYLYQIEPKPLNEVLEADMKALKSLNQPQMVNDQLAQLYSDMELDSSGFSGELVLGIGDASTDSESSSSGNNPHNIMHEKKVSLQHNEMRRRRKHNRVVKIASLVRKLK